MGRQKVWFSKILHIPVSTEVDPSLMAADMTKRIMFAKKLILTHAAGFQPAGAPDSCRWVTYSTSIGGENLGSVLNGDRWVSTTADIWGTVKNWPNGQGTQAGNSPHPWCVLKAPPQFAYDDNLGSSETQFYMSMYKGITDTSNTPMGLTFKYREPTLINALYNSPMYSDYIDGTVSSDPYAWGFAHEGTNQSRVYNAGYTVSGGWFHSFGVSGLKDVRMLVSMANDGSYIMVLTEQGTSNYTTTTESSLAGVAYIEACIKIQVFDSTGFQTMQSTHNVITISNVCKPISRNNTDFLKEYPHHTSLGGRLNTAGLFSLGGPTSSSGFQAGKLSTASTLWGDNQLTKATPAWPFGYGSFPEPLSSSSVSGSTLQTTTEPRSIASLIRADALEGSILGFPYYAMSGCLIQTGASSGVSLPTIMPLCSVPDIYLSSGGLPPGLVVKQDGEYWLTVGELLIPVGSETSLY
jgi:hypothetical protein